MLRVKKKSSITGGKGKISMVKINMTAIGIANDVHGMDAVSCRSSDRLIAEEAHLSDAVSYFLGKSVEK